MRASASIKVSKIRPLPPLGREPRRETARAFFSREEPGRTASDASRATGIAYSTLWWHWRKRQNITAEYAVRLQRWSRGDICAAKTLGIPPIE